MVFQLLLVMCRYPVKNSLPVNCGGWPNVAAPKKNNPEFKRSYKLRDISVGGGITIKNRNKL